MAAGVRRFGPGSDRPSAPSAGARTARQVALASRIGNRAMQRVAAGDLPAGLSTGARALQRDTPTDDKPDPKSGWWVKFEGSHSAHGDWLPLGNFAMEITKGTHEGDAFVDVYVDSPKGLHLGEALDAEEHITVLVEQRAHDQAPIRETVRNAVITSIARTDEVIPTGVDPSGTYELTKKRRVIRVGLQLTDATFSRH